ncbi:MAG: mannonate dehydratase, partial [Acidobacteria bacterium]
MTHINRRDFARLAALAPIAHALTSADAGAQPSRAARSAATMYVGTQHGDSDAILRAMAGFGVNHICSRLPSERFDEKWSVDSLSRLRERVESFGITLDMVPLPMSSNEISRFELPNI